MEVLYAGGGGQRMRNFEMEHFSPHGRVLEEWWETLKWQLFLSMVGFWKNMNLFLSTIISWFLIMWGNNAKEEMYGKSYEILYHQFRYICMYFVILDYLHQRLEERWAIINTGFILWYSTCILSLALWFIFCS